MTFILELLISAAIVIGGTFVFIGSFGLLKLPELMSRLHGPSKATTLGVGGCLIASMLHFWGLAGRVSIQEFLVTAFLFVTAPVTAHFIAKAHLLSHQELKERLPPTRNRSGWATYEAPPQNPSP